MAHLTLPAALKPEVGRFATRAAQLEKYRPIVTYWCEYYILQHILNRSLHTTDAECQTYAITLMDKLEVAKSANAANDAITDDVAAKAYMENFALDTFTRGDEAQRSNTVTRQTADTFQAASTFLDLLSIWGPLDQEVSAKSKFAKFHALRIAKAIKAGEDPNATNPVVEEPKQPEQPDEEGLEQELSNLEKQGAGAGAGEAQGGSAYQPPTVEDVPRSGVASRSESAAPTDHAAAVSPLDPAAATGEDPVEDDGRQASIGGGYFPSVPSEPAGTPGRLDPDVDATMTDPDRNFGGQDIAHDEPPASMHAAAAAAARGTPHDPADFYSNPTAQPHSTSIPTPPGAPSRPSRPPPEQMDALPPSQPPAAGTFTPGSQPSPATFAPPSAPAPTFSSGGPPLSPPSAPAPAPSQPPPPPTGGYRTDDDSVFQAQKHAKWAISALNFEDVETAVKELRGALTSLGAS
ncbi:hypothetical protein KC363_g6390 [Hortaea werneckii]|uniref:Vta1/callose synthase N-terminal domain-containing protein n=1 Tax=Hortaea werneckii TaxID=91943 RepID=A0A3M7F442_HORWE|nr:hypothetical protein KC325_g6453 [Hortaea werneckii]KAI6989614.1 hypothetical protein KC359_g7127 [Hortaea werneckii]KAI7143228.1 hypothetical protein KC344_g6492 [Hortaea werneckii]KAI7170688.1 hypothetical protein KC360_g6639 [Hortaea werneckii]KAI7186768.1 hypothetical protein KC363_g6390 [Hortaea werneckii]